MKSKIIPYSIFDITSKNWTSYLLVSWRYWNHFNCIPKTKGHT